MKTKTIIIIIAMLFVIGFYFILFVDAKSVNYIEPVSKVTVFNIPYPVFGLYINCNGLYKTVTSNTMYYTLDECSNGNLVKLTSFSDPIYPLKKCTVINNRCYLQ